MESLVSNTPDPHTSQQPSPLQLHDEAGPESLPRGCDLTGGQRAQQANDRRPEPIYWLWLRLRHSLNQGPAEPGPQRAATEQHTVKGPQLQHTSRPDALAAAARLVPTPCILGPRLRSPSLEGRSLARAPLCTRCLCSGFPCGVLRSGPAGYQRPASVRVGESTSEAQPFLPDMGQRGQERPATVTSAEAE